MFRSRRGLGEGADAGEVASIVLGTVAGLPAVRAAASHFVVMVEAALLVVAGPRVVEQARGLPAGSLERAAVGGAHVHHVHCLWRQDCTTCGLVLYTFRPLPLVEGRAPCNARARVPRRRCHRCHRRCQRNRDSS